MGASFFTVGNEIQTTDNVTTPMGAVDVPVNSTAIIDITVVGRALDGTSKVFFHKSTLSQGVQVLTLVNNLQNTIGGVASALWTFTIDVNEQNQLELLVNGGIGTTIDWRSDGTVIFFQPEGA